MDACRKILKTENIKNLQFLHDDIKNMDISVFNGIYFYNAFHELIPEEDSIENPAVIGEQIYFDYSYYLFEEFEKLKRGTLLVTYYGHINQVPNNYQLLDAAFEKELKLWIKK